MTDRPEVPAKKKSQTTSGLMSIEDSTSLLMLESKIQHMEQQAQQQQQQNGKNGFNGKKRGQPDRLGQDKVLTLQY